MQKTMSLTNIGVFIKSEAEAGVQALQSYAAPNSKYQYIEDTYGVPLTGGGITHNPEHSDSAVITPDLMKLPSVVTKVTSNAAINLEASGHLVFVDLTLASIFSDSTSASWKGYTVSKKGVSVTITAVTDAVLNKAGFSIKAPASTFASAPTVGAAAAATKDRVARYQWVLLDGFTDDVDPDFLQNNRMVQVERFISDEEIFVTQELVPTGGAVANINIAAAMARNGVPRKTWTKDPVNGWKATGDVHPTFTVVQDYFGATEKFVYIAKGCIPETYSLTVNANAIVTATCSMIGVDTRQYYYADAFPFVVNEVPVRSYPSVSSASGDTVVYIEGKEYCVKDFSLNLNGLAEAIFCVGKLSAAGASTNPIVPEVKATMYLGAITEILKAIYDYDTKTWTPLKFAVQMGDILGNKFVFSVMNCSVTGEVPGPGTGVAEVSVSGKGGRFLDEDTIPVAMGGTGKLATTANEIEKTPFVIEFTYIPYTLYK